jgi:peptidyl-prolyl cis-trans isomerase C
LPKYLVAVLVGLALIASACGVSRSASEETLTDENTDASQSTDDAQPDADAGDDEPATTPTTVSPEPTPTPSTAPAGDAALTVDFGDEMWELTHGELNDVIIPTWENQEFITRAFGGTVPQGFYTGVANEFLIGKIIERELASLGGSVTDVDSQQARESLLGIMQSWYPEEADPAIPAESLYGEVPYLPFVVGLQASQSAVTNALAASGELAVEAPCVRHILVDEETTAQEVLGLLNDGGEFATLATEYSTGPSGPTGGDLGCSPSDGYVPEFANAVDTATVGQVVGPVQTQFGWHVLVVEGYGSGPGHERPDRRCTRGDVD